MDIRALQEKLGMKVGAQVTKRAQELQRLSNVHFNSASFGVGEVCKSVLCLELACTELQVPFNRSKATRVSGMSDKAYVRCMNALQNALGIRNKVDVRELAVQFGCVRLVDAVHKALTLYKTRFLAALPAGRRASADFGRPVFTSVAFFLCAKKNKLKVDKMKLLDICGISESEFGNVATSMLDLCFDILGIEKEKKDPAKIRGQRDLLDALPSKRKQDELEDSSDENEEPLDLDDGLQVPGLKRSRKAEHKAGYDDWKSAIMQARNAIQLHVSSDVSRKPATKQTTLSFSRKEDQHPVQLHAV